MADIKYVIKEHIGILNTSKSGWTKELNIVSWNDAEPKFDIREWDPEHKHMSRGMTFSRKELRAVVDMMADRL